MTLGEFKKANLLTDNEIARFCGVSRVSVFNWRTNRFGITKDCRARVDKMFQLLKGVKIKYRLQASDILDDYIRNESK